MKNTFLIIVIILLASLIGWLIPIKSPLEEDYSCCDYTHFVKNTISKPIRVYSEEELEELEEVYKIFMYNNNQEE